jgi:hypothetical protein
MEITVSWDGTMMGTVVVSKTAVPTYEATKCSITESSHLHSHSRGKFQISQSLHSLHLNCISYTDFSMAGGSSNICTDMIIMKYIFQKYCGRVWSGFLWLRIRARDGLS